MELERIKEIKRKYEKTWLQLDDVVSVGIGLIRDNQPAIIIGLKRENRQTRERLPRDIENVPVSIEISGPISAQS